MKILLVKPKNPSAAVTTLRSLVFHEPLELAYLAAAVGADDEVRILDARLFDDPAAAFRETVQAFRPELVGVTAFTCDVAACLEMTKTAKAFSRDTFVVVGGHHATALPEDFDKPEIDAVVRGEGCGPFREIVARVKAGKRFFADIPGVFVSGQRNEVRPPLHPELDSLPFPRRDLYRSEDYIAVWPSEAHPAGKTIFPTSSLFRMSFGCVMNCSFCVVPGLSGRRHLTRNVDGLLRELGGLPTDHVYFCDDESFTNVTYAETVAARVRDAGIRKRYFAWARSTSLIRFPKAFAAWREIGLDAVFFGFEAITDQALRDISKGATVKDNETAHRMARDLGIAVIAAFIIRPDYRPEDFKRLGDYVRKMPPAQCNFTVLTPAAGSADWFRAFPDRDHRYPYRWHDGFHPLTPTATPLKDYYRYFAELIEIGLEKNPLRQAGGGIPLLDIHRVMVANRDFVDAIRETYWDYPESLW